MQLNYHHFIKGATKIKVLVIVEVDQSEDLAVYSRLTGQELQISHDQPEKE